jgi:hypothetical protein
VGCVYFYDLPVYRLSSNAYDQELEEYIDKVLFPPIDPSAAARRTRGKPDANSLTLFRQHPHEKYGCWEFNEIVGYIKLHFLGTQVRGEYFSAQRKRIVRSRSKVLEFKMHKLAPEVEINAPLGNTEILAAIRTYIAACTREQPNRFIDTASFERLAPHVDWLPLFAPKRQSAYS